MDSASRVGNDYTSINIQGGRTILGNVYGQSSDERALGAILDSLRYEGMTDRRDTLAEAREGTFDWTFLEGETKFPTRRWINWKGVSHEDFQNIQVSFKAWLEADDEGLFCVMGKPGSGKSTFMCVHPKVMGTMSTRADWTPGNLLQRTLI
jgi:dephospho-CoA kinase